MDNKIYNRVLDEANSILQTNKTIREVSEIFGVSKSTVHKDIRERLFIIDKNMYDRVSSVFDYHACIKHIRGGEATKRKFLVKKCN